jgi:putative spermidine/putrescine transport system permease protein
MANIALFFTFPVYINYIGQTKANPAAALTIISFGITWFAMVGILLLGRRPGRGAVSVGGAR